jgi:TetR/AcrR family transcriptional repressor of nem operon
MRDVKIGPSGNSEENRMPLVSREQTASYRRTILDASARLFRERGFKGVSVADLMGAAGLTHGGFYGHFDSKDALAAEACTLAFGESIEKWKRRIAGKPGAAAQRRALVDGYLTALSRNDPGNACPTAALVNDVAREARDSPVRAAYLDGTQALIEILNSMQQTGDAALDRREALADFATLVGAIVMSRATVGTALSDDILAAARDRLNEAPAAAVRTKRRTARTTAGTTPAATPGASRSTTSRKTRS